MSALGIDSFALVLLTLSGLFLLATRSRRALTSILALQAVGVFVLTLQSLSLNLAAVKLVSGWMAAALLALQTDVLEQQALGRVFRVLAGVLLTLTVWSVEPLAGRFLPGVAPVYVLAGLTLFGLGLLQLGFTANPLVLTVGLLTVLTGFDVIYAALENSLLVAGLLAVVQLLVALTGSYWSVVETEGEVG
ncbi:MAG: hypothetical protein OHK0052_13720 [Anaerolineales bacterium]